MHFTTTQIDSILDAMLDLIKIGIFVVGVSVFGGTIWLMRHTAPSNRGRETWPRKGGPHVR